ncbi:MAG: DHH family phosphoesterase [Alistipes sp.]|nr:DHH family phosphoesterase [Alistipes sp.]
MVITEQKLDQLREILQGAPKKIALLTHTNPDGDTIGAALAWRAYLERLGHTTLCIAPNRYPYFLEWMTDIGHIGVFKDDVDGIMARFIAEAEIIFCMDFNQINRLDRVTDTVTANTTALRILIDHHLHPPVDGYVLQFSDTHSCSTSYIVYQLIMALAGEESIDQAMAESMYVGIMTDTGNFSFSTLSAELFRAVAVLIERGVNVPYVNSSVYDNFSEGRMRLLGYMLNDKMVTNYKYGVAHVSLTEEEMRRFNFIQGDSEGFVNYPLSIRGIRMSAMFIQTKHSVRVSLRSRGDVDVNVFARRYFDGGGHRNAAGGRSYVSMDETLQNFHQFLGEYFGEKEG